MNLKGLEKFADKFPLRIIGFLITVGSLAFALYMGLIYEKKPEVLFQIINDTNVLDIKEQVKDLDISFMGKDITKSNLNLRILTLKILNSGRVDILQSFYDDKEPFGFRISDGNIIDAVLLDSSSPYLRSKAIPDVHKDNVVVFERFIFEQGNYVILKILLLHDKNKSPSIIPIGKIAGISDIPVIKSYDSEKKQSFLSQTFYGGYLIQLVRLIAYPIGVILFVISIVMISMMPKTIATAISAGINSSKRKKVVEGYKKDKPSLESYEPFFKLYIDEGFVVVKTMGGLLSNKKCSVSKESGQMRG